MDTREWKLRKIEGLMHYSTHEKGGDTLAPLVRHPWMLKNDPIFD